MQRFREGFTVCPAAQSFAALLGTEERAEIWPRGRLADGQRDDCHGYRHPFAPVLDVGAYQRGTGERSTHSEPRIALEMATRFIDGMHDAGMKPPVNTSRGTAP